LSITNAVAEVANNVLDKFVQDKDLKEQLAHNLKIELIELDKAQIEVNKVEPAQGGLERQVIYNFETEDNYSYIADGMRAIRGRAVASKGYMKSLSGKDTNIYQGSMKDEYERKFNTQPLVFEPQKYNAKK
jgi:hypothetical protein